MPDGKPILPADKIARMEELGFVFNPRETWWNEKIQRLKKFKAEHFGNVRVREHQDKDLAKWIRECRKRAQPGQKYPLSDERIAQLKELGVDLKAKSNEGISFDVMLEKLRDFKEKNGSCHVPAAHIAIDPTLYNWCNAQRTKYNKKTLSPEKIAKLEEMGFPFRIDGYAGQGQKRTKENGGDATSPRKRKKYPSSEPKMGYI